MRAWGVQYRRGHQIVTSFGSRFTVDFWMPVVGARPPVIIETKNFGVTAVSTANSRGRKAQEALYLLAHVRRHCSETRGARIILRSDRDVGCPCEHDFERRVYRVDDDGREHYATRPKKAT